MSTTQDPYERLDALDAQRDEVAQTVYAYWEQRPGVTYEQFTAAAAELDRLTDERQRAYVETIRAFHNQQ